MIWSNSKSSSFTIKQLTSKQTEEGSKHDWYAKLPVTQAATPQGTNSWNKQHEWAKSSETQTAWILRFSEDRDSQRSNPVLCLAPLWPGLLPQLPHRHRAWRPGCFAGAFSGSAQRATCERFHSSHCTTFWIVLTASYFSGHQQIQQKCMLSNHWQTSLGL